MTVVCGDRCCMTAPFTLADTLSRSLLMTATSSTVCDKVLQAAYCPQDLSPPAASAVCHSARDVADINE